MLVVNEITKYYKKTKGVENLSFKLKSGKALGIIGINGSGKTTTFRVLLGLLKADNGSMTFKGEELKKHPINLLGYLPEERSLYKDLTVFDHIMFLGRLKKIEESVIIERLETYLKTLKISKYKYAKINQLSKGNQQKIQIICALIGDPQVVILDEPLSGLDIINVQLLKRLINDLKARGKYILLSSHQFEHIEEFCDELIILKAGNVQYYGSVKNLISLSKYYYLTVDLKVGLKYIEEEAVVESKISGKLIQLIINDKNSLEHIFNKIIKEEQVDNIAISQASIESVIREHKLIWNISSISHYHEDLKIKLQ